MSCTTGHRHDLDYKGMFSMTSPSHLELWILKINTFCVLACIGNFEPQILQPMNVKLVLLDTTKMLKLC